MYVYVFLCIFTEILLFCLQKADKSWLTVSQAVKPLTCFLQRKTDAVSLTVQSALKYYYSPATMLILQKHPAVTARASQTPQSYRNRIRHQQAVSRSLTSDTCQHYHSSVTKICTYPQQKEPKAIRQCPQEMRIVC